MGSYPKPELPRGSRVIRPSHAPRKSFSSPSEATRAKAQTNLAERSESGTPSISSRTRKYFSSSDALSPAYRAECTPGRPSRASTHSPESSARVTMPVEYAIILAFFRAFSSKVAPSSTTYGMPGTSDSERNKAGSPLTRFRISWTFPWFVVAIRILSGILCIEGFLISQRFRSFQGDGSRRDRLEDDSIESAFPYVRSLDGVTK